MNDKQTKELIKIVHTRLKMIFQTGASCQNDTLWYNSMTTLLDQCTYDIERAIRDFFKTNVIVNKNKDILSDFFTQYHNYEGKK